MANGLGFDGGRPPDEDDEHLDDELDPNARAVLLDPGDEEPPEWTLVTVERCLGAIFLLLHWTLGRGGPADAFLPDRPERREMATPLRDMLNRFALTRAFSRFADVFAFSSMFGGFVQTELKRTADYREGRPVAPDGRRVDFDLSPDEEAALAASAFASAPSQAERASRNGGEEPQATPPLRAWRPPSFTDPALDG